jgi:hypothetical protein
LLQSDHSARIDEIERRVSQRELVRIRNSVRGQAVERKGSGGVRDRAGHVARPLVGSHAEADFEHMQAAATLERGELSDRGAYGPARPSRELPPRAYASSPYDRAARSGGRPASLRYTGVSGIWIRPGCREWRKGASGR